MVIYEVIELGVFDYSPEICTTICSTKEKAKKEWERRVSNAKLDAEEYLEDNERVIEENADNLYFDAYKDGYASEWEIQIIVVEKEVDEE